MKKSSPLTVLDVAALAPFITHLSHRTVRQLDRELTGALVKNRLHITICGVVGVGSPAYGFYRLHLRTPSRWWAVQDWIAHSQDPLALVQRLGNGAAAHVVGGITEVIAHPTAQNAHLHPAIGEVLRQLARFAGP